MALVNFKLLPLAVKLSASLNLADVFGLHIVHDGQNVLVLMDVQRVKLERLHVGAGALLAIIDGTLVNGHQRAGGQPQLVVVLKWHGAQERVLPESKGGVGSHAATVLAALSSPGVRRHFVVKAEDVLLKHVALVEGLVAEVAAVLADSRRVVLVMLEVDVELLLFDKQFSASTNLQRK